MMCVKRITRVLCRHHFDARLCGMAEKQKTPLGPTGETLRQNVKRIRDSRRLTYVELSNRLAEIGRPIPVLGLRRIEAGERRVDVDDLVALARVLGVNVSALLLPPTADQDVEITGGPMPGWLAWAWADGLAPLVPEHDPNADVARLDFAVHARPRGWRGAEPTVHLRRKLAKWLPDVYPAGEEE